MRVPFVLHHLSLCMRITCRHLENLQINLHPYSYLLKLWIGLEYRGDCIIFFSAQRACWRRVARVRCARGFKFKVRHDESAAAAALEWAEQLRRIEGGNNESVYILMRIVHYGGGGAISLSLRITELPPHMEISCYFWSNSGIQQWRL